MVAAVFVLTTTLVLLMNAQLQSRETDDREFQQQATQLSRDLAMEGRKMVLAAWTQSDGTLNASPFTQKTRDGGHIRITSYGLAGKTLDFTVQADFDSTVHEVRSRYEWQDGLIINPFQLQTIQLNPTISPSAQLNFSTIALDDQNFMEIDEVLIQDLNLAPDLAALGVGMSNLVSDLGTELASSGMGSMSMLQIDQTYRDLHQTQDGIFFPNQVSQAVEGFALANPSQHITVPDLSSVGSTFGIHDSNRMLTVTSDLTLTNDLDGRGILVVEGDLTVPAGIDFNWRGIIMVKPPSTEFSPKVDFSGNVNLQGMFVFLQDALLNIGHMDVSAFRDMGGVWAYAGGADLLHTGSGHSCLKHKHNYSSIHGNHVVFHTDHSGFPNHQNFVKFNETLGLLFPGDEIFFELFNHTAHGLGLVRIDLASQGPVYQSVPAGFDSSIVDPGSVYRTKSFPASDLEHLEITMTRPSSLLKLLDPPVGTNHPGCDSYDGPVCVWQHHDRYGAFTLRMYTKDPIGFEKRIYGTSLYWHKRPSEDSLFTAEMDSLRDNVTDPNNALDLTLGSNVTIDPDLGAVLNLVGTNGAPFGPKHLGTWHRQWRRDDPANPL